MIMRLISRVETILPGVTYLRKGAKVNLELYLVGSERPKVVGSYYVSTCNS
jgi:hypothetical protein